MPMASRTCCVRRASSPRANRSSARSTTHRNSANSMFLPLHDQNPIRHISFPYVTYGLIAINVLVFLVQLSHQPESAFNTFAITFAAIPDSAWAGPVLDRIPGLPDQITLVTYAFLHADWLHLLTNMLFLWVFGDNIEDAMGHVK